MNLRLNRGDRRPPPQSSPGNHLLSYHLSHASATEAFCLQHVCPSHSCERDTLSNALREFPMSSAAILGLYMRNCSSGRDVNQTFKFKA